MKALWTPAWLLILCLSLAAPATEERPTLGIDGNAPLRAGQQVKVLVSHASYPRLEDFLVSATYLGPLPRTQAIGHPNDYGILRWTPSQGGTVLLRAIAPGNPPVEISRRFQVEGRPGFPSWWDLFGLSCGLGLLLAGSLLWRRRKPASRPAAAGSRAGTDPGD